MECLVFYGIELNRPPSNAEFKDKTKTYRFIISSDRDRVDAVIKLVFGEMIFKKKVGNRSFRESDEQLMREMKDEMATTGETKESLLNKYAELAQARNLTTQDESVRERLNDVYQSLFGKKAQERERRRISNNKEDLFKDFETDSETTLEEFDPVIDDLRALYPFLQKYKKELINLLEG